MAIRVLYSTIPPTSTRGAAPPTDSSSPRLRPPSELLSIFFPPPLELLSFLKLPLELSISSSEASCTVQQQQQQHLLKLTPMKHHPAMSYVVSGAGLGRGLSTAGHGGLTRKEPPERETAAGRANAGRVVPNAISTWSKFLKVDLTIKQPRHPLVHRNHGSFFIDEEKKVAVVFDIGLNDSSRHYATTAFIVGEEGYFTSVNIGKEPTRSGSYHPPLVSSSYLPSLLQINQPHQRKETARRDLDMSITRRLEQRTHWEKLQIQHIFSAFLRNALFILNLGCYHYVNNSKALNEAILFFDGSNCWSRRLLYSVPTEI
ncbi:hypothetical protein YC2023_095095 [Brassica napus]